MSLREQTLQDASAIASLSERVRRHQKLAVEECVGVSYAPEAVPSMVLRENKNFTNMQHSHTTVTTSCSDCSIEGEDNTSNSENCNLRAYNRELMGKL